MPRRAHKHTEKYLRDATPGGASACDHFADGPGMACVVHTLITGGIHLQLSFSVLAIKTHTAWYCQGKRPITESLSHILNPFFETGFHCGIHFVAQAGLETTIFLPWPPDLQTCPTSLVLQDAFFVVLGTDLKTKRTCFH